MYSILVAKLLNSLSLATKLQALHDATKLPSELSPE
jgi:hypothetical protein